MALQHQADLKQAPSRYDPSVPHHRWKLWVRIRPEHGAAYIVVFWRRVLCLVALLGFTSWFGVAGAAYFFLQQRHNFSDINYWNIALPQRWTEHRRALGRHYIELARGSLREGRLVDALQQFSAGVARVPDDVDARRHLAALNTHFGRTEIASRLLVDGLRHGGRHDLEYLRHTFTLLLELQREEQVLQLALAELPAAPNDVTCDAFVALQAATANFLLGRYDACESLVREWRLARSLEGVLLLARCDWERGYPNLALSRLERVRDDYPGRDELPLQLIRFYRDLGDHHRAHQEALVRISGDPLSPGPRVDLLHSLHLRNENAAFARETDVYLRDFGHDPAAVLLLARLGSDLGVVELCRRASAQARLQSVALAPFQLSEIEALVGAERYREARQMADALQTHYPAGTPAGRLLSGWRAVAAFADNDAANGEVFLQAFIADAAMRGAEAIGLAAPLERVGAVHAARRLLVAIVQRQPENQLALTRLVRIDAASANIAGLEENLPQLLAMKKPSRAVLQEAYAALNDATPARAALRRTVGEAVNRLTANPEPAS